MKKSIVFILISLGLLGSVSAFAVQLTEPKNCPSEANGTVKELPGEGGDVVIQEDGKEVKKGN